jgi:cold shock CspA family protein
MRGIVKKIDERGFGIINCAGGLKVPFILSDFVSHQLPQPGQKVVFSIRRVSGKAFANNVIGFREDFNAW